MSIFVGRASAVLTITFERDFDCNAHLFMHHRLSVVVSVAIVCKFHIPDLFDTQQN